MASHEWGNERAKDHWVDDRLQALRPGGDWMPDAGRTLSRLHERSRARALAIRRWLVTSFAAAAACVMLLLLPASRACAEEPGACVLKVLGADQHSGRPGDNVREVGFAWAPITLEIYIDYQCDHCGVFVRDVVPALKAQYVTTGRVKLHYRDYPLPSHSFARPAARYVYVAGELGYYETAMRQLLATQGLWSATGGIDAQLAQVLPASAMKTLRGRIEHDSKPDNALAEDQAAAQTDHVDRTPFVVIVSEGKHQPIPDATLDSLKRNLDHVSTP